MRIANKFYALAIALFVVAISPATFAQTSNSVPPPAASMVGTWRMTAVYSWTEQDKDKINKQAYGPHPGGLITYTPDGRMSVLEVYDNRRALSADREAAPAEERAEAFSTMVAYAGSYTFAGDKVVHHIEVAAAPGPNRDQVRFVTFRDHDHISLRTPPVMRNGVAEIHEMFWERVK
jgi:Lipocalin-like domain